MRTTALRSSSSIARRSSSATVLAAIRCFSALQVANPYSRATTSCASPRRNGAVAIAESSASCVRGWRRRMRSRASSSPLPHSSSSSRAWRFGTSRWGCSGSPRDTVGISFYGLFSRSSGRLFQFVPVSKGLTEKIHHDRYGLPERRSRLFAFHSGQPPVSAHGLAIHATRQRTARVPILSGGKVFTVATER